MNLSKERLRLVDDLNLEDIIETWDDAQTEEYSARLVKFVDTFITLEAEFKKVLFMDDTAALSRILSQLAENLKDIHADNLSQLCNKVLEEIPNRGDIDKFEADMLETLAAVATLSIDIQMEQYRVSMSVRPKTRKMAAVVPGGSRIILAVDDIPVTLNVLKSVLTTADYKLYGVTSGAAALDFVSKITPDLFILDIEMPQMNGFELAEKLRDAGHAAPVIFLTGNTMREHLIRAVKAGAVDFLVKPVNPARVIGKVKKVIDTI